MNIVKNQLLPFCFMKMASKLGVFFPGRGILLS